MWLVYNASYTYYFDLDLSQSGWLLQFRKEFRWNRLPQSIGCRAAISTVVVNFRGPLKFFFEKKRSSKFAVIWNHLWNLFRESPLKTILRFHVKIKVVGVFLANDESNSLSLISTINSKRKIKGPVRYLGCLNRKYNKNTFFCWPTLGNEFVDLNS